MCMPLLRTILNILRCGVAEQRSEARYSGSMGQPYVCVSWWMRK